MTTLFSISPSAAQRISFLSKREKRAVMLRVRVESGGCAGFQYHFLLEEAPQKEDHIFENGDARVIVDPVSLDLLEGSELDYIEEMMEASFSVRNPKSVSSCGCGTSFSIF